VLGPQVPCMLDKTLYDSPSLGDSLRGTSADTSVLLPCLEQTSSTHYTAHRERRFERIALNRSKPGDQEACHRPLPESAALPLSVVDPQQVSGQVLEQRSTFVSGGTRLTPGAPRDSHSLKQKATGNE
jgi:hypothetical protein